jgi:hypothetical protein
MRFFGMDWRARLLLVLGASLGLLAWGFGSHPLVKILLAVAGLAVILVAGVVNQRFKNAPPRTTQDRDRRSRRP